MGLTYSWVTKELGIDRNYRRGDRSGKVRAIQEWLSLQGEHVAIDGEFGPATDGAVRKFQGRNGIPVSGTVDQVTYATLTGPLTMALAPLPVQSRPLSELVVAYANQHLAQHPLEIGGQNCGPWVRLYMEGNQGTEWPWCAGFACFVLRQAADTLEKQMPFKRSFSCDILVSQAKAAGTFISERDIVKGKILKTAIPAGSLFVNRRTDNDWSHTGIAIAFHEDHFETIEGNTNDAGDREGYEVCRRVRGYEGKDFIRI